VALSRLICCHLWLEYEHWYCIDCLVVYRMFVPRPQTTHVPPSYTTQTTRKTLNKDKENANALPSKTPSRAVGAGKMLVPNTARVGLGAKSVGGKNTEGGKGKGKEVDDIGKLVPPIDSGKLMYRTKEVIREYIHHDQGEYSSFEIVWKPPTY
jgi:hypothetical protein